MLCLRCGKEFEFEKCVKCDYASEEDCECLTCFVKKSSWSDYETRVSTCGEQIRYGDDKERVNFT